MKASIPGYFLAVCRPVPDVLLLLLHAVLDPRSAGCGCHCARAGGGAESGAAVRYQVMGPRMGSRSVLGGISAGSKLFLGGGAVLRGQTPPPTAAGH